MSNQTQPQLSTKAVEGNDYSDLLIPTLSAKTILLADELNAQDPRHGPPKISIRKCMLEYAKEAEMEGEKIYAGEAGSVRKKVTRRTCGDNEDDNQASRDHIKLKTPVIGSEDRLVRTNGDYGFFSSILEAYNNHWSLRTCVEDWWYTIIRRIAVAIDENAKRDEVRDFFVSHQGKKKLTVTVGPGIYGVDYSWFLDQMTKEIADNIEVPNYVEVLKSDYSTSTKTHIIVSEITVMASVQEYFEYRMLTSCGIPSLEMEGEEEDWIRMEEKFGHLKDLLKPISSQIGLDYEWWNSVEEICNELINTFNGEPNVDWWSNIFTYQERNGSGATSTYDGWFISDLLGLSSVTDLSKLQNGIITVPMTIINGVTGTSEESAFAAGIVGFELFKEKESPWPSVKAAHGWTLMIEPNSEHRVSLATWESELSKGA